MRQLALILSDLFSPTVESSTLSPFHPVFGVTRISYLNLFQWTENFRAEGVVMVVHDVLDLSGPMYDDAFQVLDEVLRVINDVEDTLVDDVRDIALLGVHYCPTGLGLPLTLLTLSWVLYIVKV